MSGANPIKAAYLVFMGYRARRPDPRGQGTLHHAALAPVLTAVADGGVAAIASVRDQLAAYLDRLQAVDPDSLTRPEALAFWINLYNAAALRAAGHAFEEAMPSVFRLKGAFSQKEVTIAGEDLSLTAIENGKVRRFGDPRIHAALVCGAISCPTLRHEPYEGSALEEQLDDQMRFFLASGGFVVDRRKNVVRPSRILLWYGADFARPHRMPALIPPRPRTLVRKLEPWLPEETTAWLARTRPRVRFQRYDFGLACAVR